jgi:anti-sigma factor RsiW
MNCEQYQSLISDFIDGSLTPEDYQNVESHLGLCGVCADVRGDLDLIVTYCQDHRGEYEAVPNERALWLRISNLIDAEAPATSAVAAPLNAGWWFRLMNRSWQLTFPQLAASVIAVAIIVSVATIVGLGRFDLGGNSGVRSSGIATAPSHSPVADRYRQQQQTIDYWNQRVELNKTRWNPQMRETFERNLNVIDAAVNDSMHQLNQNPHDEVSEEILNAALNDKVELLKEFAEL